MMDEKKAKESTIKEQLGGAVGKKIVIKKKSSTSAVPESKKPLDEIFDQTKLEKAKQELPRKEEIQLESPQQVKSSTEKPKQETESKPPSSTEKTVVTPQTSSSSQIASPKSNNPIMGKLERNPIVSKPTDRKSVV